MHTFQARFPGRLRGLSSVGPTGKLGEGAEGGPERVGDKIGPLRGYFSSQDILRSVWWGSSVVVASGR